MAEVRSFEDLKSSIRPDSVLRDLPNNATQLCEAIDKGTASAATLERIILGDPGLTAGVLRASSAAAYGGMTSGATTIRQAIMTLGERAVRSLAVAVWMQAVVQNASAKRFDAKRFAQHSMFVGLLARYLFSMGKRTSDAPSALVPDEVFAASVLHDLGLALIASVEPDTYDALMVTAQARKVDPTTAFIDRFEHHPNEVAVDLLQAWNFPTLFPYVLTGFAAPWEHQEETLALASVHYANVLAENAGDTFWSYPSSSELDERVKALIPMQEESDEAVIVDLVRGQMRAYRAVS